MTAGRILFVELEDRQQLHCRHAEVLEIADLLDQPAIRATQFRGQTGTCMSREPADVHLVDHGLRKRPLQRNVALPVIASGSATTLFIAVAQLSPGSEALMRL